MPTSLKSMQAYTISISEGQRALFLALLEQNRPLVEAAKKMAVQLDPKGLEQFNLDWESLCNSFRDLRAEEMGLNAKYPGVSMTHGFCL